MYTSVILCILVEISTLEVTGSRLVSLEAVQLHGSWRCWFAATSCWFLHSLRLGSKSWIKLDQVGSCEISWAFFELGWGHSLQHDDWRRWCPRWMLSVAGSKDGWNQRSTQMKRGSRGCFGQYHWVYPSSWIYWLLAWSRHLAGDLCGHMGGWQQSQIRIWSCRQAPIEILEGLWMKCVMTLCSNFDVGHSNLVWPCQSSYGFRGPTFRTHLGHMRRTDTILCNVQSTMLSFCHSYAPKPSKTNFQAMAPVFRFTRIHCRSFHAHPQTFMCVHCL